MPELQQSNTFNGYGSLVVDFRIPLQNGGEDGQQSANNNAAVIIKFVRFMASIFKLLG